MSRRRLLSVLLTLFLLSTIATAEVLRINGSTTVNPVVVEAAEALRAKKGLQIQVDTQGGSSGGISALADGRVQMGMSSRPINDDDRKKFPNVQFHPVSIGTDAVAIIVSRDVWEGGVKSVTRAQMQQIYEGKITNWKEVGGSDRRIVFFNKEPGRGTWEVFAHWLYGDAKKAPSVSHPEVGANEEARTKVRSTRGAVSQLSSSWADNKQVFALGIKTDQGQVVRPDAAHIAEGSYPLTRPLFVVTNGEPKGEAKAMVDFLLSKEGQALVRKHGYLALADVRRQAKK
ncbi:MAG TPA: phosphate ABC transporter substrate-binding protein [Thermoanaerobaculia bacterium]|nr:phosphate ABC transporter substrate-binding protein [Thermoanaerobaculia bacterium]